MGEGGDGCRGKLWTECQQKEGLYSREIQLTKGLWEVSNFKLFLHGDKLLEC